MATNPRNALPKRFRPFFDQSATETAIRYGSQESALGSLLEALNRDRGRESAAQMTAGGSVLGAYQDADKNLQKVYTDAGLTPSLLGQIADSPTGQRLAGELASGRGAIQAQATGAQAGQQYIQQHISDQYNDDFGKVADQVTALTREKGLYQSSLLDQLISGDRSARHTANEAARQQQHADEQAILDRGATTNNALIGQGLLPGADGTLQPLPGGKADPNAPGNKPKRTSGAGTASPDAQRGAGLDFKKAFALANGLKGNQGATPEVRQGIANTLTNGKPASQGKVVYEDVPVLDARGQPTGKTKRQPKLDPDTGQQITSASRPAVPAFDAPIAAAATEQALFGYVTTKTVRELQKLGYSVNQIPGLKTENAAKAARPKTSKPTSRPKNAPSGTPGQVRPT